ncbi:hypothetical protein [Myroides sp. LJL119]
MKNLLLLICAYLTFISCGEMSVPPAQNVYVENYYMLEIPAALAPMEDLYPNADFEYGNTFTQVYLVSMHQSKAETKDFEDFMEKGLKNYQQRKNYKVEKIESSPIDSLSAKTYFLQMDLDNQSMFMTQTFIDGKKANYQIISWSPTREKVYDSAEVKQILASFKEVK